MLLLSFHIDTEQYAIAARQVIEILPLIRIQPLPQTPAYIVGLLDFRGNPVPIIDLCQLTAGRADSKVLSTRIILVSYQGNDAQEHTLGLIAEKVTETITIPAEQFTKSGVQLSATPYLGKVTSKDGRLLQYIEVNELLPQEVQAMLFADDRSIQRVNSE